MQKLIEGVHKFRAEEFGRYRNCSATSRGGARTRTRCSSPAGLARAGELITKANPAICSS
jgi:hypothetical protein